MPELPEVETVRRGITPHLQGRRINRIIVRDPRLRWPVPEGLDVLLKGLEIEHIERRAKYLLLHLGANRLIMHLGMSGRLYMVEQGAAVQKHDHVDIELDNNTALRFTDPRRFGCILLHRNDEPEHKLLSNLGPEPLSHDFSGDYLFRLSRKRNVPIKSFLMSNPVVVGVGNIYANEALHQARIHPEKPAGKISKQKYLLLAEAIKNVLAFAIEQGGTTLKDFVGGDGKPGYFAQELQVYGRAGQPCYQCGRELREIRMAGRSTVFCGKCQRK